MKITKAVNYDEVREAIKNSSKESKIYLGCDSQNVKKSTIFGLSIIIHIDGNKGGKLFVELYKTNRIKSLRERLMKEVELAVTGAFKIMDVLENRKFEIHLDVNSNPDHQSNTVCKEAIGYVVGQGFNYQIKPLAFAASSCADHCIKH